MTKCDAAVEDRACLSSVKDPVCSTYSEDEVFKRKCMSKARYETFAADCKLSDNCFMAMCEESGCTASGDVKILSVVSFYFKGFLITMIKTH